MFYSDFWQSVMVVNLAKTVMKPAGSVLMANIAITSTEPVLTVVTEDLKDSIVMKVWYTTGLVFRKIKLHDYEVMYIQRTE